jgi:uroporphyrinogen III methyltransferase/synthase
VLVPRALKAREVLPDALRELGVEVDVVPVYRTETVEPDAEVLARLLAGDVDCVSFTSGAIAQAFVASLRGVGRDADAVLRPVAIASIGPVTTEVLEGLGFAVDIEATEAKMESLAAGIASYPSWKR